MINQPAFYNYIRTHLFAGKISLKQHEGLQAIINYQTLPDLRYLAYILATTYHETDKAIQPVKEYGRGRGKPYGIPDKITKQTYYGRGFVQLTWKTNYERMARVVGLDLVNHPDLALNLHTSTIILFHGMIYGTFTGKKLSNYFNAKKESEENNYWVNARRIINGLDKAELIAGYGKLFYTALTLK